MLFQSTMFKKILYVKYEEKKLSLINKINLSFYSTDRHSRLKSDSALPGDQQVRSAAVDQG